MKVITVTNQKGGVGKTATTLNLAASLKRKGCKVLAIDLDPQKGNLTQTVKADKNMESMFEVLGEEAALSDVIQQTEYFDLAPATVDMANIDDRLNSNGGVGRERRLKNAINKLPEGAYDYIIIDTPPALSLLTTNALVAADYVLVISESDVNAMHGMKQLDEMVNAIRQYYNPDIQYAGILLTKFNERTNIGKCMHGVCESMGGVMNAEVFSSKIRSSVMVPESIMNGTDLFTRDPNAAVTKDYETFVAEISERIGGVRHAEA